MPEQVQDFYPTPSTISTCMYYTGLDPRTMEEVYVPKSPHEKALQRALIQYRNPKNHALVVEALAKAGRTDLIGFGKECLVRPRITKAEADRQYGKDRNNKSTAGKGENGKSGRSGKAESSKAGKNGKRIEEKANSGRSKGRKTNSTKNVRDKKRGGRAR